MTTKANFTPNWPPVLAICLLVIVGCSTSDPDPTLTPAPTVDLAVKLIGSYKLILLNQISPAAGPVNATRTGTVVVTRNGAALDQVIFKLSITRNTIENGAVSTITSAEDKGITLKEAGKAVDLYESATKLGRWSSDTITVTDYSFNGNTVDSKTIGFVATK